MVKPRPPAAKTSGEPAQLVASTGYLLARLGGESRRRWAHMLSDHGLTPHHFGVLMVLQQLDAASQQQLSRLVGVDPRNVVAVLDVLEHERLIRRRAHPTDRRRHTVSLTPAGRQLLAELGLAGERIEEELLNQLSPAERDSLHQLLLKLFHAVTL
jgi:DNA-binding MarR family transcriptional regulator